MPPAGHYYEIHLAEPLADCWKAWFSGLEISCSGEASSGAVLQGYLPDQTALFGVLETIRNLNLTLLLVKRLY
jgi:hypothetical protein